MNLIIPGEPTAKARPRFFNNHAITPTKTVNYETLVKEMFAISGQVILEGELEVDIDAYFSIPPSTSNKKAELMRNWDIRPTKKPDLDNIAKIVLDALNTIAYHDDSQVVSLSVNKYYSDNPRVVVNINERPIERKD